jgi:uncharacterized protein (TIGR04141 family)
MPTGRTNDEPHINQISAQLLRAEVADPEDALVDARALDRYELRPDSGLSGRLYVKPGRPNPPPWQAFLGAVADRSLDDYRNEHASAVLFVDRGGRTYALTFGFGRHLLDPDALEPDFGLKVAAGLVNPDEMTGIDSRLVQSRRLQVRRQAGRGATSRDMGLDVNREMVRALSGRILDDTLGSRISGADALGLTGRTDVATLLLRLDRFLDAYERKLYLQRFPVLERWLAVSDSRRRAELDAELVEALANGDKRLGLGVPEVVDWRVAGFKFDRESDETRHPFPDLSDYLKTRQRLPELKDLRRDHLIMFSVESDQVIGSWTIYHALDWETQREGRVYFLADGGWYEIDADYLKRVDARLVEIDKAGIARPDFDPREHEADYNKRLATHALGRACLDRKFAYEDEAGKVEICDVFTAEREFVHVKRDFEAEGLSHLFAQGAVSAELFSYRPEYRARLRELLAAHPGLAEVVPTTAPDPSSFRVAFGIISEQPDRVPADLPVFSRVHLTQMADLIERMGFKITVFGINTRVGARPIADGPTEKELRDLERRREADAGAAVAGEV